MTEEELFLQINPLERLKLKAEEQEKIIGCDKDIAYEYFDLLSQEFIDDLVEDPNFDINKPQNEW